MSAFPLPPEQWSIVNRLLDEALELPESERAAWLASLPPDKLAFKPLLERMLARAGRVSANHFLEDLPFPARTEFTPGLTIGPWRLIRLVGEGGMASVWLADRIDGVLGRHVALKLPHEGLYRSVLFERMDREREILATLNHPNISRLLDAGVTPSGQPYMALEYVEGQRIDEYCEARQLGIPERLRLFLQITRAVAHAHARLVVHRDLKPANILVSADGTVHLLDFGIARLLESGKVEETDLTRVSGRALTLDYASPEQISGGPITVASDVYSLGVVLYELITRSRPYRPKRTSRAALEEAILETEPRPPSAAVPVPAEARRLRGDLDALVLKALRKDPAARYPSVEAFSADVTAYLEVRPIQAQRDTALYRLQKFARRNRFSLAVAFLLLSVVLSGAALVAWQAHQAFLQQRRAEEAKQFLVSVLLNAHSYWAGRPLTALDLLKLAREKMEGYPAGPETRVELLCILSASLLSLQETTNTEVTIAQAVAESARLPRLHPQALRARMIQGWARLYRGQSPQARQELLALIPDLEQARWPIPEDYPAALRAMSQSALDEGDTEAAGLYARRAVASAEQNLGLRHNQSVLSLICLSEAQLADGQTGAALDTAARAWQRGLEAYSHQANHPNVLKARVAHGRALAARGQKQEGEREVSDAITAAASLFGPASRAVGLDLRILARLQIQSGNPAAALQSINRSLAVLGSHFDPQSTGYAELLHLRGAAHFASRHTALALADLTRAEELLLRNWGPTAPAVRAVTELRRRAEEAQRSSRKSPRAVLE